MPVSTRFLVKCSVYVAIGGITSVFIMRSMLIDKVRKAEYYKTALKEVRNHQGTRDPLKS